MADSEARFARRLGFAVGRWDWWKIKGEHTPHQWALQLIADRIDPIGEPRADMRAAVNTARLAGVINQQLGGAELAAIVEQLRHYLDFNQPADDRTLTPEEAAELKAQKAAGQ